jgi:hypothetical protein
MGSEADESRADMSESDNYNDDDDDDFDFDDESLDDNEYQMAGMHVGYVLAGGDVDSAVEEEGDGGGESMARGMDSTYATSRGGVEGSAEGCKIGRISSAGRVEGDRRSGQERLISGRLGRKSRNMDVILSQQLERNITVPAAADHGPRIPRISMQALLPQRVHESPTPPQREDKAARPTSGRPVHMRSPSTPHSGGPRGSPRGRGRGSGYGVRVTSALSSRSESAEVDPRVFTGRSQDSNSRGKNANNFAV